MAGRERDACRSFAAWRDEGIVWLIPGLEHEVRWKGGIAGGFNELAIPAEHLERIDIYHVGSGGDVCGPGNEVRFPSAHVGELLDKWLNLPEGLELYPAPDSVKLLMPVISEDPVYYRQATILGQPVGTSETVATESERAVVHRWPPASEHFSTVSPDAESDAFFGSWTREENQETPILVNDGNPTLRSFHVLYRWPEPLTPLFPFGGSLDDLHARERMLAIAERGEHDSGGAIVEAKEAAAPYVSAGTAQRWFAEFLPTYVKAEREGVSGLEDALTASEVRLDLDPDNLNNQERLQRIEPYLDEAVQVRRAWGAAGLFWVLLLDRLESGRYSRCQRCGRLNAGRRRTKRSCGKADSEDCYRAKRRQQRRAQRDRMKN